MKDQSTTKGFAILSIASMAVKLLSLVYMPLLLVIIGEEGYAPYYAAYTVFVFIYVLTNTGMSSAISKLVSELVALKNYKDAVKTFKISRIIMLLVGTIMAIFMIILAKPLAYVIHFPKAYLAIAALAPAVLFTSIASAYRGYFQGRGNMGPTAVSQVIEQIANVAFSLLFAFLWLKHGIEAACAGGTVGTTLGALIAAIYLMRKYEKNKKFRVPKDYNETDIIRYSNSDLLKKILFYALPLTISSGLQYAGNVVDAANTKGRLLASGLDDKKADTKYSYLGKFQTLIGVPIAIISALCTAILPLISSSAALNDKKEVKKGIDYAFKLTFLISIPSAVGLAVLSTPVFNMIYPKYSNGAILMKVGSVVLVLMALVQIQSTILQSIGKLYLSTFYIVLGILGKIVTNYIFVAKPSINILGTVFGSIVGFLIPLLLNHRLIEKSLRIRFNLFKSAIRPVVASALMGVVAYLCQINLYHLLSLLHKGYIANAISTILAIFIGGIVYIYALALIGGITKRDINSMPRRITKFIPRFILTRIR